MNSIRFLTRSFSVKCTSLIYSATGDPTKVLQTIETKLPNLGRSDILVEFVASPINPADINMVQGTYAIKPELPAIGGNEGFARVIQSDVISYKKGDLVIPSSGGFGTWRTHAICKETDIIKIDNDFPLESAATMSINPSTAYRMIKDFERLSEGDVVIQNGANSAVGQAVIQMCKYFKLRTINIIRNRSNVDDLIGYLKSLGATHVITEDSTRTERTKELISRLPKPKLGLNAVAGKSAAELIKFLETGGTLVTYGGMSKQPSMIPTGSLIFYDVRVRGFWMTRWTSVHKNSAEQNEMINFISDMIKSKALLPPLCDKVPFSSFELAVKKSMEPLITRKQILVF